MDKYNSLIVIAEKNQPQHLSLMARAAGIQVCQLSKDELLQQPCDHQKLLAFDLAGRKLDQRVQQELQPLLAMTSVFLYNTDRQHIDEYQALQYGIRGVLHRDLALDKVMHALRVLMTGQLYYPRDVMSRRLEELVETIPAPSLEQPLNVAGSILTKQERKIIELVARGARNKEIADNLHISAHTVKAHMATIFRKTQVRNRIELLRIVQQPQRPTQSATTSRLL